MILSTANCTSGLCVDAPRLHLPQRALRFASAAPTAQFPRLSRLSAIEATACVELLAIVGFSTCIPEFREPTSEAGVE